VPVRGEMLRHPSGAEIEILEADARRIRRLRVHVPERSEAASGEGKPE
jgi:Mg2+/Co2+ transporter CorC